MLTKQKPSDMSCQGNAVLSLIAGAIKGCVFADIVLVKKVNGKTLTVFPLVTGTNASGGSIENQDVYNVPFIQYQAGNSSVKMTPRVGDIGLVIVCDKDITNVGNDSNLLIVFYVQIMPDDFVMQLHRF